MSRQLAAFGSAAATLVACLIATENVRAQATVHYAVPVEEPMRVAYASGPETSPVMQDTEQPVQSVPAPDANDSDCDGGTCSSSHQGGRQRSRLGQRMADKWNNHWKPCLQWTHWGYDEFQKPRPLGDAVYGNLQAQVWSGLEAQLVVYQCDFHQGILQDATELNDRGLVRLQRLAEMMDCGPFTLAVEKVPGDDPLSQARYATVIEELSRISDARIAPERVVLVGPRRFPGYDGREGRLIGENLYMQTENAAARQNTGGFTAAGLSTTSGY